MKAAMVTFLLRALVAWGVACVASVTSAGPVEVQPTPGGVVVEGRPIAAIIVTQCSQLVAVYMVMPDGRLLRFDKTSAVPWDRLLAAAYSAMRSERIEVSCNGEGIIGFETHVNS